MREAVGQLGGPTAVARLVGYTPSNVHRWLHQGYLDRLVPALILARKTGIDIARFANPAAVPGDLFR